MKIYLLIGLVSLLSVFLHDKNAPENDAINNDGAIEWTLNRPLAWSDFSATPDFADRGTALTSSSIHTSYYLKNNRLYFNIQSFFHPQESWVKTKNPSAQLLQHEQGHFDLTEAYARIMRKMLQESTFSYYFYDDEISIRYNQVFDELDSMQKQYDAATQHSVNREAQTQWQRTIANLLQEYATYDNADFSVALP
ncbi:MAG: hypothetical protein R2798_08745 [Chitinophagales bacterium]|nr:hypothetical protein [Bacteroidota bacterium]MCB9043959.1 hypothetical protein [Chitinophagales bacterium]